MNLQDLKIKEPEDLLKQADDLGIENPSSLRLAILEVLSNNRLREVLARNSIKYIENNNSLQETLPKEFNAYKNCLKLSK